MPFSSATAATITVAYNERPPYLVSNPDGTVSGLTATPVANAFHQAQIPFVWEKNPTNRQLQILKESGGMYCAVGWFKNPAREKFAKFTKAVYRDKPSIVIANLNFSAPPDTSLAEILTRPDVHVLVKDQYSYGPYVDGLFARLKPALVQTTAENINMIRMIKVGRADFMLASEEEASYFVEQAGFSVKDFQLLKFKDMPAGEKRYLMCSKDVPDELINQLNKAINFE